MWVYYYVIITLNVVYYYVIINLNVVYYYVIITLKVVYYYVIITLNVGILLRYYFLKCGYFKRSFFWMGIRFDYIKLGLWNKLGWIVSKLDDVQNLLFEWLAEARVATRYHHLNLGTELKKSIGMKVRSWKQLTDICHHLPGPWKVWSARLRASEAMAMDTGGN